jgi:K+-transporting ATPase A subunit
MDVMNEVAKTLQVLATQLGTTVEHLWGVLLRQAPITGVVSIIQYIIVFVCCYYAFKGTKYIKTEIDNGSRDETWWCLPIITWVILGVFLAATFFSIDDTVACFINPEYWALEHVLYKIKGI